MKVENNLFLSPDKFNWDTINENFDWIRNLRGCPQSPIHHAEGDVWIHTNMVVEELFKLADWSKLSKEQKSILYASALLHDVEKPSCTVIEENGDITSRGHAKRGEYTSRRLLMELGISFETREQISKLVRFHGLPIWFLEKDNPERAVVECSLQVDTYLLSLLAEADMRGRICQDLDKMMYQIELFKEFCKEKECFGKPREFTSDHSRFIYFNKDSSYPGIEIFDDTKCEVTIMSGLPGSGKNTWIKKNKPNLPVIELDSIRKELKIKATDNQGEVVQLSKERAREFLRKKQDFIWNATNTTKQQRGQLIDLFSDYGAKITIVFVSTDIDTIYRQNGEREAKVPEKVIEKLLDKLEVPNLTECHKLIIQ